MSVSKQALRREIKVFFSTLVSAEYQRRSRLLEEQLFSTLEKLHASFPFSVLGLYVPLQGEPCLDEERWWSSSWQLAFPTQLSSGMGYAVPAGKDFPKGAWLKEGQSCVPDVIIVPGLSFSPAGFRLGRGGGFYDRMLEQWQPRLGSLGVCFEEQLRGDFEVEAHDRKMDLIITDSRVLRCGAWVS